jgi:predicted Rossmann fold flavoprotein
MRRFGSSGRFMSHALRLLGRDDLLQLMRQWGVPCSSDDGFHYFPVSQRAGDVLAALENQMALRNVQIRVSCPALDLLLDGNHVKGLLLENGEIHACDRIILAAGGAAWPSLGGGSLGYDLAVRAGHDLVEPAPALVGLSTRETWPAACAGVSLPAVRGWIDLPGHRKNALEGILLFTHAGVSGPLILDLSSQVTPLLKTQPEISIRLALKPDEPRSKWEHQLHAWREDRGKKTVRNLLDEQLPHSLALAACAACGIDPDVKAAQLTAPARDRLAGWLTAIPLTVTGSEGMARAMVTRGGVNLRGVNPATLESRLVRGLFFAGEVVDLDGPCGGYNLQWAFSSGRLAGLSAAGRETKS